MKKYLYIILASLVMLSSSCSRDELAMLPTLPDNSSQYAVWLHNVGAIIDNKRPHPDKPFNIYFYFNGNIKDPVTKVTLLGKVVKNTAAADRYKDLEVIHTYSPSDWVYSPYYGADSLYMSWMIPDVPAGTSATYSAYYRIAVETTYGYRDTTAGDYWGVIVPYNVATLSSILVDGKSTSLVPAFSANTLSYVCNLAPAATAVPKVTYTLTNASASVMVTPATSVTGTEEQRTTSIKVVSESGATTNIYKVTFVKTE